MHEIISHWQRQLNLSPTLWNLLVLAAALLLGLLIRGILGVAARKQASWSGRHFLFQSLIKHLSGPLGFWIPLFIFDVMIPVMELNADLRNRISHGVEIGLIVCTSMVIIRLVRVGQDLVHRKVNINTSDNLRQRRILTQLIYIRRVLTLVILVVTAGAVLLTFSTLRKIGTGLLTGVGVGGIIIGFAAQRSLGNLLAGFQIAFTQPIRIDDEVVVQNEFGKVEEITLTYVVVRIWDDRRMILPINHFIEQPFENWTRTTANMLGTVFIYTDYAVPVDWMRTEFLRIVQANPLWDKRAASLVVTNLKESVMELRGLVSAKTSGDVFDLRCHVREEIVRSISEHYPTSFPKIRAELTKTM